MYKICRAVSNKSFREGVWPTTYGVGLSTMMLIYFCVIVSVVVGRVIDPDSLADVDISYKLMEGVRDLHSKRILNGIVVAI